MRVLRILCPPELGRDFVKLWSAATISNLGDGALLAAGPLLVASITSEPAAVAMAVFVQQLPWLLFALLSGALVDRLDRRRVVVAVDIIRGLVLAALGAAVLLGASPLWAVYLALFLLGTAETLADNAAGALYVTVVPRQYLGQANARLSATFTVVNQLGGPPIGALLFALGAGIPLVFDAVTYLVAAGLIARLSVRPAITERSDVHLVKQVGEGVRWLWNHPGVRTLAGSILVMNVTFGAAFATWVLYARERLGLSEQQFGVLIAVGAIGALAGTPVYHLLEPRIGTLGLLRAGLVIETVTHLVLAITQSPWVAGLTMVVFGVHAVVWGTVSTTTRQLVTPDALMGRVNSVYLLASVGGAAIGTLMGGLLAQRFGLTAPFLLAFVAMAAMTAVAWRPLRHVSVQAQPTM